VEALRHYVTAASWQPDSPSLQAPDRET
jgi:hypothetical protein